MAIAIRPGTLELDRLPAIGLLARHLNPAYDTARFDWLHSRNPAGPGRFWMAVDSATGETVGTAAAFPRLFSVGGREERGWVLGDFCVSDRHRSLGPALKLQRSCLDLAADAATPFCYDFPSRAMMTVYQRLRIAPRGQMRRLVKLLRVEHKLSAIAGFRRAARAIGRVLDGVRALRRGLPTTSRGLALAVHTGPFGEEFSRLADAESPSYGMCVMRSAAYLNWRYRENPTAAFEVVTARQRERLVGYAVFTRDGTGATLVDLFGTQDRRILRALVWAVSGVVRQQGGASLNVSLLDSHPWVGLFRRWGFARREASPFVLSTASGSSVDTAMDTGLFLMSGDRDS
ncbi:MAG: hypothetical protein ACHQ7H_20050 [Candidatus Rokuibacteriota bacterium]